MKYREIEAKGFLNHFIKCFWYYETKEIDTQHTILPDGYFDLIAEFSHRKLTLVKLTGIWTTPKEIRISKNTQIFAVRFKLPAIEYVFKDQLKSILDTSVNLALNFWQLDQYHSDEFEHFVVQISKDLEILFNDLNQIDHRKLKLFRMVYDQEVKTVAEISNHVFWSSRQINRYFQTTFGITLKEFLNIVRCHTAYRKITGDHLNPNCEYYDQAHFIKQIKKYTGTTPKELSKNKNDRFIQLFKVTSQS
ncbi:AraC family transcriptional regulator [Acinetobacter bereziniae]|uniref:AraC family transcriptional regulator n=1 Tax=Acinetobacter bereziniae TaxID=106648 RepID=UPI002952E659|nr:AraC family transcriptional regulator [Acinetobacter bereziniae]MDV8154458.1 AraC family transcriptional regulator [Acinetobacter bereziniae]